MIFLLLLGGEEEAWLALKRITTQYITPRLLTLHPPTGTYGVMLSTTLYTTVFYTTALHSTQLHYMVL